MRSFVVVLALSALPSCGGAPSGTGPDASVAGALVVLSGDGTATNVSLVGADGTLSRDGCLSSATPAGGPLAVALSGDVTLPSQPQSGGALWLVDRANATLTIVDPATCAVKAQWSVATGFASHPHDVAVVSDAKVYVTRFEKNPVTATGDAVGDDVLVLDRASGAVTGHIDLSPYASVVAGAVIQARPDRMVKAVGKIVVTLADGDEKLAAVGVGRVVVIDPTTDTVVSSQDLAGLKGCSAMDALAGTNLVFVSCGGSPADPDPTKTSGLVMLDLSTSPPTIDNLTTADAFGGQALNPTWVASLSQDHGLVGTVGTPADPKNDLPGTRDALFAYDLLMATTSSLALHGGAGALGRAAVGPTSLFVPDATPGTPLIHVFAVPAMGAPTETSAFAPDPALSLPPREIAFY